MRLKKLIIIALIIILPIIIYNTNIDKKIYYLSLGDSLALGQNPYNKIDYGFSDYVSIYLEERKLLEFYSKKYADSDYRTTDLLRDIEKNKKIKDNGKYITLKNALANADIVTLSIGFNDLIYKININNLNIDEIDSDELKLYVEEVKNDIEMLIEKIKLYCKEDIILIGYYNPFWHIDENYALKIEDIFIYSNSELKKLAIKYDLYYVDVYNMFKENQSFFPNPKDFHPSNAGYRSLAQQIISIINKNIIN